MRGFEVFEGIFDDGRTELLSDIQDNAVRWGRVMK